MAVTVPREVSPLVHRWRVRTPARYGEGMGALLLTVVLSFPVVVANGGRLRVGETVQTPAAVTIPLRYTNDTDDTRHARVRCTLLTRRGDIVNSDSVRIAAVKPGETRELRMRIVDSATASDKASCEVEWTQTVP